MEASEQYMKRALRLAARARGRTSPNPLVGAVVVQAGRVVGEGYHRKAGTPHAEILALAAAAGKARGADLYLNLEPCSHYGRTPPCVDAIIAAGIDRVFVGMRDPNPLVNGRGLQILREAGIEVAEGILEDSCRKINEVFIKYVAAGLPFVILKGAATLDGRIAAETGDAKWISNEASRRYVHRLRDRVDAILVGAGTAEQDNPRLTTRLPGRRGKDPVRIIVDSTLRVSPDADIFSLESEAPTIVATTRGAPEHKRKALEAQGAEILAIDSPKRVDLGELMRRLAGREITSVLIEGGSRINTAALESGLVDKVIFFYAPRLMGGRKAPLLFGGKGVSSVQDAIAITHIRTRRFGDNIMVEGYVAK
jgi:diaminohydroxyphosphoribosylaminopyrimidine deaminase/5-amino-6-(5-phosphoribosylamino)uracil reductase